MKDWKRSVLRWPWGWFSIFLLTWVLSFRELSLIIWCSFASTMEPCFVVIQLLWKVLFMLGIIPEHPATVASPPACDRTPDGKLKAWVGGPGLPVLLFSLGSMPREWWSLPCCPAHSPVWVSHEMRWVNVNCQAVFRVSSSRQWGGCSHTFPLNFLTYTSGYTSLGLWSRRTSCWVITMIVLSLECLCYCKSGWSS